MSGIRLVPAIFAGAVAGWALLVARDAPGVVLVLGGAAAMFVVLLCLHDASHGSASHSRALNEAIGWAGALLVGGSFVHLRRVHELHHASAAGDPERWFTDPSGSPARALAGALPLLAEKGVSPLEQLTRLAAVVIHAIVALAFPGAWLVGWLLPAWLGSSLFALLGSFVPHARRGAGLPGWVHLYHPDHHADPSMPFPELLRRGLARASTAALCLAALAFPRSADADTPWETFASAGGCDFATQGTDRGASRFRAVCAWSDVAFERARAFIRAWDTHDEAFPVLLEARWLDPAAGAAGGVYHRIDLPLLYADREIGLALTSRADGACEVWSWSPKAGSFVPDPGRVVPRLDEGSWSLCPSADGTKVRYEVLFDPVNVPRFAVDTGQRSAIQKAMADFRAHVRR